MPVWGRLKKADEGLESTIPVVGLESTIPVEGLESTIPDEGLESLIIFTEKSSDNCSIFQGIIRPYFYSDFFLKHTRTKICNRTAVCNVSYWHARTSRDECGLSNADPHPSCWLASELLISIRTVPCPSPRMLAMPKVKVKMCSFIYLQYLFQCVAVAFSIAKESVIHI